MKKTTKHVYIIGAKGISFYGGYESFLQKLLEYHNDIESIQYHIACKANGEGCMDVTKINGTSEIIDDRFTYFNADCFLVKVPEWLGSAQAILYDILALRECCRHIQNNKIENPIVYILACRIGPFVKKYVDKVHILGGKVYLNPDGHEWKRAKWSCLVRKYWKESERLMVRYSDLIICDSVNIEKYILEEYKSYKPKTTYIAYGAETRRSSLKDSDPKYTGWINKNGLENGYFTMIGRFVPENNFETIIREFMKSKTDKALAIITTNNPVLLGELEDKLHYKKDGRIKFVGTVYDQELLMKIRENASGYFHGHSVGGTNPSLLEALGSTKVNLLFDVGFNREVGKDAALYWSLEENNLAELINRVELMDEKTKDKFGKMAKQRIQDEYSWKYICDKYQKCFNEDV